MPATYNGNAAGIAAHEAPAVQTALATDLLSEEGFNVGLRKLADYVAYLNQKGALLDAVNLFTAIVQLGTGSGLELTAGALQSILKKGSGKLQVGTAAANNSDLELLVNGVVKLGLLAAGGIDAKGQRVTNLGAPVGATDAVRLTDAAALAKAWGVVTSAGTLVRGAGLTITKGSAGFYTVNLNPAGPDNALRILVSKNGDGRICYVAGVDGTSFTVQTRDSGGTLIDQAFSVSVGW